MERELQERWSLLEQRAREQLHPGAPEAAAYLWGAHRLFHVSAFPSFDDAVAYDVLERNGLDTADRAWLVLRRCWRQARDLERFRTPIEWLKHRSSEPEIELSARSLAEAEAMDWSA